MSNQDFEEPEQPKPPQGSTKHAEKYVSALIDLLNTDKLKALHTDLSKYDPSNLQDHYRVELKDYMVEISHSKDASTGKDSFVLLFTNLKNIRDGCSEKLILGYVHLTSAQFSQFKNTATTQDARLKRQEEERRFQANLQPIDQAIEEIVSLSSIAESNPKPEITSEETTPATTPPAYS